ncbi:MAG: (E)-4-hydroxy-3-methylbut-2-enyl-diphosphate synthase [Rikenellaceae bacterium]
MNQPRYISHRVTFAGVVVGGVDNSVVVQSMTNTATSDCRASVAQIARLAASGCPIVRLTAQGVAEGEALERIAQQCREEGLDVALVADIHYTPEVAMIAAQYVDKVRINPGNYPLSGGKLEALIELCRSRGVALRIGVNHGSLGRSIVERFGDTPQGMVEAAMEFLEVCRAQGFGQVVVSMKSSNTRVMVHAYRLLVERLVREDMHFPIHLGVTEAGNGLEARVKSAVGIGALMVDGIGDTIRVSLTEDPVAEIPVAQRLVRLFEGSRQSCWEGEWATSYKRRSGVQTPIVHSELTDEFRVVESVGDNPTHELRRAIASLDCSQAVVVKRRYDSCDEVEVAIDAAAQLGVLFLDGVADGIWIDAPNLTAQQVERIELMILQAARVRQSQTEYIACPSCGRTLFDIEEVLGEIKERTSHLKHLKIGVMGCIVNGPGEMADADYGYVGAARGRITLYKGREVIERNIEQSKALDRLLALIEECENRG